MPRARNCVLADGMPRSRYAGWSTCTTGCHVLPDACDCPPLPGAAAWAPVSELAELPVRACCLMLRCVAAPVCTGGGRVFALGAGAERGGGAQVDSDRGPAIQAGEQVCQDCGARSIYQRAQPRPRSAAGKPANCQTDYRLTSEKWPVVSGPVILFAPLHIHPPYAHTCASCLSGAVGARVLF